MRILYILTLSVLILCPGNVRGENPDDGQKNILVLCALAPTTPAYKPILDGIRLELNKAFGDAYNLHTEYLETERYPADQYPPEKYSLIVEKYENVHLDLLICLGINIVAIIKKLPDSELLSLPALVIDFDLSGYQMPFDMSLNSRTAVLGIKLDIRRTLLKAMEFFPQTSGLYVISGKSELDKMLEKLAQIDVNSIKKNVSVSFLSGKTMDENLQLVRNLPDNSLVIIPAFNIDGNNVPYYNTEAIRLISNSARAPVFTYSDTGFGEGSFGGEIVSFKKVGETAGMKSVKILNGADPARMDLSGIDFYDHLLDWRQLEKWNQTGLAKNEKGYKIIYREVSFMGKYKWLVIAGMIFILLQTLFIASLVSLNRKQKRLTLQIRNSDRRYIDIIQQDRIQRMGMLTASLSHELNQPLTAILSTAQAGKRFVEAKRTDPALLTEIFDNIAEDNGRAASILKSLRGLMKIEKHEKKRANLNELIIQVADLYNGKAIEIKCKLNLLLPDKPVYVMADAIQIQQVLLNFISNATQAMQMQEDVKKMIDISENIENDIVTVSVRDYGTGIDENIIKRVFDPFVTTRSDGTGIGLSISKFIIEDHQGIIQARNLSDTGAEFSFSLKVTDET